jgi:bifunctional DNA-binding transcriptional regulator/antitoxin component of YhaV-PrlF toxin-antitoxin module
MISTTKIYVDKKGGGRVYIPQEIRRALGWQDHEGIILSQVDGKLLVISEKDAGREVKP